jgi:hypothetical protein
MQITKELVNAFKIERKFISEKVIEEISVNGHTVYYTKSKTPEGESGKFSIYVGGNFQGMMFIDYQIVPGNTKSKILLRRPHDDEGEDHLLFDLPEGDVMMAAISKVALDESLEITSSDQLTMGYLRKGSIRAHIRDVADSVLKNKRNK